MSKQIGASSSSFVLIQIDLYYSVLVYSATHALNLFFDILKLKPLANVKHLFSSLLNKGANL